MEFPYISPEILRILDELWPSHPLLQRCEADATAAGHVAYWQGIRAVIDRLHLEYDRQQEPKDS